MKLPLVSTSGKLSTITVSDAVFATPINQVLIAQAVRVYLSNRRQGSSKVQTRSEVNRTRAKWYKQKGTGNARHGSRNAPIFVGGGVAHGPSGEQNWSLVLPKTMKKQALASALSFQSAQMHVVEKLSELSGKTKEAAAAITSLVSPKDRVLVVLPESAQDTMRALFNLSQVNLVVAEYVTPVEILSADKILLHPGTISVLETRVARMQSAPTAKRSASKKVAVEPTAFPATESVEKKAARTTTKKAVAAKATKKATSK